MAVAPRLPRTCSHTAHTRLPAQVNPLKAPVSSQLKALAAESSVQVPHPFTQDRTWALESSRHAGLEPALSPSLPICEVGVMSECQGHISCRVSHLFNARARPQHLKVGLQPPREPCSQEQCAVHRLGCWQLPPFLPQPQWLQTCVPCPNLGFSSRKGGCFDNIFPELLLQFLAAPGARQ